MQKTRIRGGFVAMSIALMLALSATAGAVPIDPPPNDDLADAVEFTETPFNYGGSTDGATLEEDELEFPWCSLSDEGVWFSFTAEATGLVLADAPSNVFNSSLAVYKGSAGSGHAGLTPITCTSGAAVFEAAVGTTYYFRVAGWESGDRAPNTGEYNFHVAMLDNHMFADATEIDGLPASLRGANYYNEEYFEVEPRPCGNIGATMWYQYTAEWTGPLVAHTFDVSNDSPSALDANTRTTFDTVLAVYQGAPDASIDELTLVGCNDDTGQAVSRVDFAGKAGTTYWFQVGGFNIDETMNYLRDDDTRIISGSWGIYDLTVTATCKGAPATVIGTNGSERLVGTRGRDVIVGLAGHDMIFGGGGGDIICGGRGNDVIFGGGGGDRLYGTSGNDRLIGGRGNDRLIGGGGQDDGDGKRGRDRCRTETTTACEL